MEAISIGSDPHFYFQVGKIKIIEGMKCLQDLVQWYNNNLIPENAGILDATMAYLQSLQQEIKSLAQQGEVLVFSNVNGTNLQCGQDIESLAPQREVPVSSNVNGTNLQHGQKITQIREQNKEIEMVMDTNVEKSSCAKRKRWSKVWKDFTMDGKECAQCNHCKRMFNGSSKKGTTHLKNHLKSCQALRNPGGVVDKEKEKSLIDPALNGSDMVLKIINHGLSGIEDDILDVYKQEKDRLNRYLDKVPSRFNVKFEKVWESGLWFIICWFIDDSWKLQKIVSLLGRCEDEDVVDELMSWLVDQNIDKKICSMTRDDISGESERDQFSEKINHSFNERGPLHFIGNFWSINYLLRDFRGCVSVHELEKVSRIDISTKARNLWRYMSSNKDKFHCAVQKAVSMGKKVTSQYVPQLFWSSDWDWIMGGKEAFCEVEHIDPDFKSINFTKEEWDEATLLCNSWRVLRELREESSGWMYDAEYKTPNVYFLMVCDIFLKIVQLGKSENHYYCHVAAHFREILEKHWDNNFNLLAVITTILDPRFKMDVVKKFYEEFYHDPVHLEKITVEVKDIYSKYAKSINDDIVTSESELDRYLRDFKCPPIEGFDILKWWYEKSPTYPSMAKIARDFLSIPINSVILDDSYGECMDEINDIYDCNCVEYDLKQALACTKVWLYNK